MKLIVWGLWQLPIWRSGRALHRLTHTDRVIVDGNRVPKLDIPTVEIEAYVKADEFCMSVAAASVMVKVIRDAYMVRLAGTYPEFFWERNKGYRTLEHRRALACCGPSQVASEVICEINNRLIRLIRW